MKSHLIILALSLFAACSSPAGNGAATSAAEADTVCGSATADTCTHLTISFCGDIMMGTTTPERPGNPYLAPNGGKNLFDDCREIISRVDIAGGNLEGSLLDGPGIPRPMGNPKTYFIFKMPTAYVNNLVNAGFDFLGNANNHINDFGAPGRESTVKTLTDAGLANAGLKGVNEWAVIERKGVKVGITQFGHGANNLDVTSLDELRRVIGEMKKECDLVVVSFHGGAEGTSYLHVPRKMETYVGELRGNVEQFAHAAIDAGAAAVFGHGPHVPRAVELYNGHIIFYSLGNFCTPTRMGIAGATGYAPLAEVEIDSQGKFVSGQIYSFIQQRGRGPVKDATNAPAKLMRKLSEEDFPQSPLTIGDDGTLSVK